MPENAFDRERVEWEVLDETIRDDMSAISGLQRGHFSILGRTRADDVWLVGFRTDAGPNSYYLFDRHNRRAERLFEDRPDLNAYPLAAMEPISFVARDGLKVRGYLTLPPDSGREGLPTVLKVHGGPWERDSWGYDPEVQWLANRGYACRQINYRGSTGYGKTFLNAGNKEWGGRMQEDLVDGVRWAIDNKVADPGRVAIYGSSYGGFAALAGAAFTPNLFRCAIDVVGPSNLLTFIESVPPHWTIYLSAMYERIGNPSTERGLLRSRSPLFAADQIKTPLLIAQGANDPRVKRGEAEQIVAALEEKGVECEYLPFQDEGHGFARPVNRLKFYEAAERFLAKHLGGQFEGR